MTQLDDKQDVAEEEASAEGGTETNPDAAPSAGTSSDGDKKTGASKWPSHGQQPAEGPSNVRGNTVWASKNQQPTRGAANDISEQPDSRFKPAGMTDKEHMDALSGNIPTSEPDYYTYKYSQYPDDIEVPSNAVVTLWGPEDNRTRLFTDDITLKQTNQFETWDLSTTDPKRPLVWYKAPSNEYLTKIFPNGTIRNIKTQDGKVYACWIGHKIPTISITHGPIYTWNQLSEFMSKTEDLWVPKWLSTVNDRIGYDSSKYVTKRGLFGEDVKFWDTGWGFAVQLVGSIAIGLATGGIGTLVEASVASVMIADAALQAGFNMYVGWQQKAAGNDFGATCSFIFAAIPLMGKLSAGSKVANVAGYLTEKEIQEVIELTGMAEAKSAEEMGERFASTIKQLEQSAGIARPGAGGVLVNSLKLSKNEAKRILMNIKKLRMLQPNELIQGSQKVMQAIDAQMAKNGVKWTQVSVPFWKKAAIKEIRNMTIAQVIAAENRYHIVQKLYRVFVLHQDAFTPKEKEEFFERIKNDPDARDAYIKAIGGEENLRQAYYNTNQTPEEKEQITKEWDDFSKSDEFNDLKIVLPPSDSDSTQNNQAPQQKQQNEPQNQPPKK